MQLTEREQVRFYEEAIIDVTESSRKGTHRGITFGEQSKCCGAELMFKNIKRNKDEKLIVADIVCVKCGGFLGDSTVKENKIKEKRNGV